MSVIDLPNGEQVFFDEEAHRYYRVSEHTGGRGRPLTGVTTIISPTQWKPDGLMRWAAAENANGIAELVKRGGSTDWLRDGDTIIQRLKQTELDYDSAGKRAAGRGSNVHKHALGALAEGKPVPDYSEMTEEEQGYARGVTSFWLDYAPKPLETEAVVADLSLGVAGTLDLIAEIKGKNGPGVIDAKTGKGFESVKHDVQIAAYRRLAAACGLADANWGAILYVNADGDYKLVDSLCPPELFDTVVSLYRGVGDLTRAKTKDRKERGR